MNQILFCLSLAALSAASTQSAVVMFQSSEKQTSLLELYTSEGCSSCPPAETWLSRLKDSTGLWKDFVPVAFHVDYWDYLGWRDKWATASFSERQRAYASQWHSGFTYTPGFALDGREWRDWSKRQDGPKSTGAKAGVLSVNSAETDRWPVRFAPADARGAPFEVHAALLAGDFSSDVKAGENRGRRLSHDFAVLTLVQAPLKQSGDVAQGEFVLPARKDAAGGSLALAVWITRAGHLEPLQATGGWLARPAAGR